MWLGLQTTQIALFPAGRHRCAVAIPARNEASDIEACLRALDHSAGVAGIGGVEVVVLVNNSTDDTADRARMLRVAHLDITVVEIVLPPGLAHAGGARRSAMDLCAARLPADGVVLTTDADSCVDRHWIAAMLAELEAGADAVAGVVTFDDGALGDPLTERAHEWQLAHHHARLHTLLDPQPHEYWPTHIWAWGASLAVTVAAYRAVDGLPSVPLAEDRAFADLLDERGFKVRRSHAPIVYTSARREGRAPGGFSDLLRLYTSDPTALCDAAIEPTATLVRRLMWRSRLRRQFIAADPRLDARILQRLHISPTAAEALPYDAFGSWWRAIEAASPRLRRRRVHPAKLHGELRRAERLIRRLTASTTDRADSPLSAAAVAPLAD